MTSRNPSPPPERGSEPPRPLPDTTAAAAENAPKRDSPPVEPPRQQAPAQAPTRRPWAARGFPAAAAASLILLAAGALLFEAVWVRTGHPATAWWTRLADELATRPVDDVWILTGAAVAAALGLWLIVLALTPGLRRQLPLGVPADSHGRMRAVLDRKSAGLLLRDAAMRVPGVSAARVRVRRRKVTVRADVRFRDTADVKDELTDTIRREEREQLALARPPRPTVRVRRSPT
ncbi:DUF6286 domain-containing protein [Streptomyces scopuliridis]|uniref:DUF6286 domain-containing protein n=1 Tax=Streptomyces scopuliridis TaxID=452529 RepID=A0ACD4ZIF6_9ACTN|nr:DUF6286 domain-containing protein [Streptomyces scopuliridis]WSB33873.1 DUF6286 domain-containing protein [Streptomyces scopuliridis]WSB98153.1 DUF6286 domain-containing protein [Streptomyces scopuliridis]WSC08145.1 DUF6286 domain-containing protein [Streptomyces scopuliridis]